MEPVSAAHWCHNTPSGLSSRIRKGTLSALTSSPRQTEVLLSVAVPCFLLSSCHLLSILTLNSTFDPYNTACGMELCQHFIPSYDSAYSFTSLLPDSLEGYQPYLNESGSSRYPYCSCFTASAASSAVAGNITTSSGNQYHLRGNGKKASKRGGKDWRRRCRGGSFAHNLAKPKTLHGSTQFSSYSHNQKVGRAQQEKDSVRCAVWLSNT